MKPIGTVLVTEEEVVLEPDFNAASFYKSCLNALGYISDGRHPRCSRCGKQSVIDCKCDDGKMSWGAWKAAQVPCPNGVAFVIQEETRGLRKRP